MSKQELNVKLSAPGMTALHKVGLAGLWMTLKAFKNDYKEDPKVDDLRRKDGFDWTFDRYGVSIQWQGNNDKEVFDRFFNAAFRLYKGLFWFPALGHPKNSPGHALIMQEALCGTVFQHGATACRKNGNDTIVLPENEAPFSYDRLKWHCFQGDEQGDESKGGKKAVEFSPVSRSRVNSKLFPGGDQRHFKYKESALEEPPANALALRFVPVGALFMKIMQERRKKAVRSIYAMVLPAVDDIEQYAKLRQSFVVSRAKKFIVAGIADAAYRVVVEAKLQQLDGVTPCRVFSFGVVPWNKQQKSRVDVFTVPKSADADAEKVYRACEQFFPPRMKMGQDERPYWTSPQIPELIAGNLACGRKWWQGFAAFLAADDVRRDKILRIVRQGNGFRPYNGERIYEDQGGLTAMTDTMQDSAERNFIVACHEAWRNKIRKEIERTQGGRVVKFDYSRMFEKQRVALARCKNLREIRTEVRELLSRGAASGRLPTFQDHWEQFLPFLSEQRWREAQDLALLALASYKKKVKNEAVGAGDDTNN